MGDGAYEIWFRGEGAGVPPARRGGFLHDFGDGLYLSDSEDVAKIYARRRAPNVADERVWMVALERHSLGHVLDLTMDSRWTRFMTEPISRGTQSRLYYLKIKHELYDQFFREFLSANKIDIRSFDAIICPEYNLGGKQLCILHKNGLASALNRRVRALFRPTTSFVHPTTAGGKLAVTIRAPTSAKIRFVKGAGGFVASVGLMILLSYLINKSIQEMYNDMIEKQIKALDPDIQASLERQKRKIFSIADNGHKAYAIVNIKVEYYMSLDIDPEGGGWDQSAPGVELVWVDVRDYKVEGAGEETVKVSFGQRFHSTPYTLALELTVPKEELDQYRAAMEELEWYETALHDRNVLASDVERLTKEKKALEEMINKAYGAPTSATEVSFKELGLP
jgi:hypothetical protein